MLGNLRENLLVGQTVNYCTGQETEQTRDDVIEFSFAGPGDAGAWSVPGQSHADPEDQPADQIADDIGGGTVGKVISPRPRRPYRPIMATTRAVIMNFNTAISVKRNTLTILLYLVSPALFSEKPKKTPRNRAMTVSQPF